MAASPFAKEQADADSGQSKAVGKRDASPRRRDGAFYFGERLRRCLREPIDARCPGIVPLRKISRVFDYFSNQSRQIVTCTAHRAAV
jgi:hypothetical protein